MRNDSLRPVFCILGPTGVGKTGLSLEIAEALNGEIISADSMQVYQGMNIGTAKVSASEKARIPHHCLDLVSIHEEYSVARYQKDARQAIAEIHQRGKPPIMVGGTGLYIQAALEPYDFSASGKDLELREQLWKEREEQGKNQFWNRLREVDPQSAEKLHENDSRRVIRALEVYYKTGVPLSVAEKNTLISDPIYKVFYLGFQRERSQLYQRIEQRIGAMIKAGLREEVLHLIEQGLREESTPGQALGYKEFFPYFRGESSLDDTILLLQRDTRRYAKRQLTWFRRMINIHWVDLDAFGDMHQAKKSLVDLMIQNL